MISMELNQLEALLDCEPGASDVSFTGVSCDSRRVSRGMLFAALPGRTFDGHDHIEQAYRNGAVAALVSRQVDTSLATVKVDSVLHALGALAAYWRLQCKAKVVGITGSNGKTTVKEMIASILREHGSVLATEGNFNNELGLPLTVFGLSRSDDFAVLEMGASHAGDIAYLAGIARPDIGVITNIGPAHLQGFQNLEGVAAAKGELFAALPANGTAIINAREPWKDLWSSINTANSVSFFLASGENGISADINDDDVVVKTPIGSFPLNLPLPGEHNLSNALAATAACLALDVALPDIKTGLEKVKPVPGRLSLAHASQGWIVIDDTYNANPASLYAAIQVLASQSGEPWLVLGDMKELGTDSRKMHAELGVAARSLGVKRLFAVGDASTATVDAFGDRALHFEDRERLIEALCSQLRPGVACLVKGSRSMGMEQVVNAISNRHRCQEVNN